jgi:nickel-dependent lactate racemase
MEGERVNAYILPFGKSNLSFELPVRHRIEVVEPAFTAAAKDPLAEVKKALKKPLNGKDLKIPAKSVKVAIAINDKTRPVPHEILLPPLLEHLERMGISKNDISFYIASGTHQPMKPSEYSRILPSAIYEQYRVTAHDCDDSSNLIMLGETTRKTPIFVNKGFYESDIKIVVGNIEPHHFSGFSGGMKTAAIGLTGRETINRNHAMLMDSMARIAEFDKNPLRKDIEEIGKKIKVNVALNAVLNSEKRIVRIFYGDPHDVILAGIPVARQICQTSVKGKFELVLASVGGHPKDINLYQAQKALTHAALICKDGGVVILVAACPEGSGSSYFEEFMQKVSTPQQALEEFKKIEFRVGPHKAFQFARELVRIHVILVSEMPSDLVRKLMLVPAANIRAAIQQAEEFLGPDYAIAVLPHATNTIPLPA